MPSDVGSGDRLARGAVRATFRSDGRKMTDAQWNKKFEGSTGQQFQYLYECPTHGHFAADRASDIFFGAPYEGKTSKCLVDGCDETAVYGGEQPYGSSGRNPYSKTSRTPRANVAGTKKGATR